MRQRHACEQLVQGRTRQRREREANQAPADSESVAPAILRCLDTATLTLVDRSNSTVTESMNKFCGWTQLSSQFHLMRPRQFSSPVFASHAPAFITQVCVNFCLYSLSTILLNKNKIE